MSKKGKNRDNTTEDKSQKFPDIVDKTAANGNVRLVKPPNKRIKLYKTPTQIIRGFMVFLYLVIIFMLASPFMSATFYITENFQVTTDPSGAYTRYSTQEQVDNAEQELQQAIDSLEKNPEYVPDEEDEISISTLGMDWRYNVAAGVDASSLVELVERAKNVDRSLYTEKSVNDLNNAIIRAQRVLCSTVRVTRSILQLILSGSVSGTDVSGAGNIVVNVLLMYLLAVLPVVGILITLFDKIHHIKNISGMMVAMLCLMDIFGLVYPNIAFGAVMTITAYIILFALSIGGIYAKQQEDYILTHPEKEPEFTEKHPQFVKALINYKRVNMKHIIEQEEKQKQSEKKNTNKNKK